MLDKSLIYSMYGGCCCFPFCFIGIKLHKKQKINCQKGLKFDFSSYLCVA